MLDGTIPPDPETIRAGMASVTHRGPDGSRHWISEDGRVALGHTRLSIINLTNNFQAAVIQSEIPFIDGHTVGQDPDETSRLLEKLVGDNQVSRGLLLPEGDSDAGALCRNLLGFVPSCLEAMGGTSARMRSLMRDDFLEPHRRTDVIATLLSSLDVRGRLEGRNAGHSALYLWAKTILPHYILSNLGDRMEMAHSVEGRVPFMDHKVAEYLHQVPVSLKIRGMTEKYILREAAKDVLTTTVYERQKHPFLSPPATLHPEEPLHALMQEGLGISA